MDPTRILSGALAVNRIVFGASYLVRPASAGPSWIGRAARVPGAQVMIRGQGARDVALGAGALWALARHDGSARAWMAAHALADGADTVATWVARGRLPAQGRRALAIGAGSTAVALLGAAGLGRRDTAP
jgi:hypothetical protein